MSENTPETQEEETKQPNGEAPQEETKKAKAKPKKAKANKPKSKYTVGEVVKIQDYEKVALPESEDDPHWDPKMRNPVPDALVHGLAEFDWDPSMAAVAYEGEDGKLHLIHGKTRWRALERANKLRAKMYTDSDPITTHVLVVDESADNLEQVIHNMRRNVRLNAHQQQIDPMTKAESILRALSSGQEEKQVADDHAITVNDLHGYLLLTDEDKCPPKVQELVRSGDLSFTAALELARRAEKMTKAELANTAEQIAKTAAGGVRVTAAKVKQHAGVTEQQPATLKQKKALLLEVHKADLKGSHGEAAKWASIAALEVGLGTRTVDDYWEAIDKIAKGKTIRVDLKQYADPDDKVVKGQDKK